ncbi:MAG: class I adenylate-forming enzyme family protein [Smithellaceae bacterium]
MFDLVTDILHERARVSPLRRAIVDSKQEVTYGELSSAVFDLAHGLRSHGLTTGDRCICVLPNGVDFFLAHFAVMTAGGVSVPCDYNVSVRNFEAILIDSGAAFLLITSSAFTRLAMVAEQLKIKAVIIFGENRLKDTDVPVYLVPEVVETGKKKPSQLEKAVPNDLAKIMYTTGSTGLPKGVMLRHCNVMAALKNIVNFVGYNEDDSELVILPVSHNFGLGHVYCNMMSGGFVYLENGMSRIGRVLNALEKYRITGFPGTPLGYGMLLERFTNVFADKAKSLRFIVIDSAPMPPERTRQLQDLLPHVNIMVYYGLTEASRSAFISLTNSGPDYYSSVGRPMNNIDIGIIDEEGKALPSGQIGEIVISGPTVTSGYWNMPDETMATIREGKMHTGDLGWLDHNGYLFVTGRIKDVVNVGGMKLNPYETEKVLMKYPGICDAGVVGIQAIEGIAGEAVVAGIVVDEKMGGNFNDNDCMRFCLAQLEKFKVPVRFFIVDKIPRTDSGKIKRHELVDIIEIQI